MMRILAISLLSIILIAPQTLTATESPRNWQGGSGGSVAVPVVVDVAFPPRSEVGHAGTTSPNATERTSTRNMSNEHNPTEPSAAHAFIPLQKRALLFGFIPVTYTDSFVVDERGALHRQTPWWIVFTSPSSHTRD